MVAVACGHTFGHVFLVKAKAVRIHKLLVNQPFAHKHIGNGRDQCAVRTGTDGNPFVAQFGHGVGIAGIDHDDAGVALFSGFKQLIGKAAAALTGFKNIAAKHDDKF